MESDSPAPTPSQRESIAHILQAGWHLLKLINEILDLARIESGKLSLSLESVSLGDVMAECRCMIEGQAHKRGLQITFPLFDSDIFVRADQTRLKQVLINLLSNAIKYNRDHGRVEVKVAATTTDRIRVSIEDSGAGLPPEKLAQLFQPFNRLGQEVGGEEGTGRFGSRQQLTVETASSVESPLAKAELRSSSGCSEPHQTRRAPTEARNRMPRRQRSRLRYMWRQIAI